MLNTALKGSSDKMKNKKALSLILYVAGALVGIFAIDLIFIAASVAKTGFQKFLVVVCFILLAFIAAMIIYVATQMKDVEPNFFLYDKTLRKNISIDNLTFKTVNDKMTLYISQIGETEESLWVDNVLEDHEKLGEPAEFRTVLAYKMLYDLADFDDDKHWLDFYTRGGNTVSSIADAIKKNGDIEMADTLVELKNSFNGDISDIKEFLVNNKPYLQKRMLKFVKANIELFY